VKPLPRAVRPLPLKVLYPATELAESIGISRHVLFELLRMQGVVVYRLGRVTLVPLSEIKDKLEPVWDAICLAELQRR
jgi:hypothetical protein